MFDQNSENSNMGQSPDKKMSRTERMKLIAQNVRTKKNLHVKLSSDGEKFD